MKKKVMAGILAITVIAAGFVCFCMWFLSEAGSTCYYAQIDNRRMEQGSPRQGVVDLQGGMAYSYTLPAYDENGDGKEVTFGTSRVLKEGAFICLTIMPIRGVLEWREVQYEELPAAVQSNYPSPAEE